MTTGYVTPPAAPAYPNPGSRSGRSRPRSLADGPFQSCELRRVDGVVEALDPNPTDGLLPKSLGAFARPAPVLLESRLAQTFLRYRVRPWLGLRSAV